MLIKMTMLTKLLLRKNNIDSPDYRILIYKRENLPRHYLTQLITFLGLKEPKTTLLGVAESVRTLDEMIDTYCNKYNCQKIGYPFSDQEELRLPDKESALLIMRDFNYVVFDKI